MSGAEELNVDSRHCLARELMESAVSALLDAGYTHGEVLDEAKQAAAGVLRKLAKRDGANFKKVAQRHGVDERTLRRNSTGGVVRTLLQLQFEAHALLSEAVESKGEPLRIDEAESVCREHYLAKVLQRQTMSDGKKFNIYSHVLYPLYAKHLINMTELGLITCEAFATMPMGSSGEHLEVLADMARQFLRLGKSTCEKAEPLGQASVC